VLHWVRELFGFPDSASGLFVTGSSIANLIAEPLESAPARLVVGAPFGADAINATAASAQTRALAALGLSGLEPASDKVGA